MSTELLHQMMDKLVSIDSRLDGIDTRLDGIDARLDGIDARLDGIDTRLDAMDVRLDGMDAKIDKLAEQQAKFEVKLEGTQEQVARNTEILEASFYPHVARVDSLAVTVEEHTTDIKLLKKLAVGM